MPADQKHSSSAPFTSDERYDKALDASQVQASGLFDPVGDASLGRKISPDPLTAAPVTELLFSRLSEEDRAAVADAQSQEESALWASADSRDRLRLTLAFAAHHCVEGPLLRTGLSAVMPPSDVHAMGRGAVAAGGSYYYADLIADALHESGAPFEAGQAALDFGCSSGRVVRVLAAAFPELEWHGCDPIPDAIEWSKANLPGVMFHHSSSMAPLEFAKSSFDVVFAISIWSHFAEESALRWLQEMRRIVKPGGRLVITTHGEQTLIHTRRLGLRSDEEVARVRRSLFDKGFWYLPEFGPDGDHGVVTPEWGTAFISAEWLVSRCTPDWGVALCKLGRVEGDQDLYVLERR